MKNKTYKILVLSDLSNSTNVVLRSAVGLANMINGKIEFYHVKKATDAIGSDNQLTAVRDLKTQFINLENKIQNFVKPITQEFGIAIKTKFSFGNVKANILDYIHETKPDIILLAKRKPSALKLEKDRTTSFVLSHFNGPVLLVSEKNKLEPNSLLYLGMLQDSTQIINTGVSKELVNHARKPLKSFRVAENINEKEKAPINQEDIIEYTFKSGASSIDSISNYISKNNINLLSLDKNNSNNIHTIINKLNVSLLVS